MKPVFSRLTTFLLAVVLGVASCTEKDLIDKPETPGTDQPNTVSGIVLDTQGQPVANAKVRAENTALSTGSFVEGKTGADGRYSLPLSALGGWTILAWKDVTDEDGQVFHLRMAGASDADYEPFSPGAKTVVRNFKWKLSGKIPDRSQAADYSAGYFGGSLHFVNAHFRDGNDAATEMPAGTRINITLTPVTGATYLDGSPATQVITQTFTIVERVPRDVNFYIGDIPVTKYKVTATTSTGKPVYLGRNKFNYNDHAAAADALFYPSTLSSGSYESGVGVAAATDFPYYMSER
jgi:hypothetical protein